MKLKIFILILLTSFFFSERKVVGEYSMFGSKIKFNADLTYEYDVYAHIYSMWSKGNWIIKNDTIYLHPVLIYDTLRIAGKKDSLVLSFAKKPNLIVAKNLNEIYWPESSGEQTGDIFKKLFYKKGKLFEIDINGNLKIKKERKLYYRSEEYYDPWFEKIK
jgi:hypothetical protein